MIEPMQSANPFSNAIPSFLPDRWLLIVRGRTQVTVQDHEGRRTGSREDYPNLIDNQIPGASYRSGEFSSSVFLSEPGIYTFAFTTPSADPRFDTLTPESMHVALSLYNAVSKLHTFFFQRVPTTERSQAKLVFDTTDQSAIPILMLDLTGKGEVEPIRPTILSPQASNDSVPPTTQIEINDNIVTLAATDNFDGAGVWRTYYTTDGITTSRYTEPFILPSDAKILRAYSEDRAGNLEHPGTIFPVFGISEMEIVLSAKARDRKPIQHVVNVVNLDPIPITGPLQWVAFTEAPWLSIEPRAGLTPNPITVSADPAKLDPGHHETTLVIRALTPRTIFAERILRVVFETVPRSLDKR